ncbi:hypothetical protein NEOKW01_0295 [Nematocida sp. AWRm80]|nr:hypothetical protein NEOKW01_0295 [Nematocida sp. AWRm80]
MLSTESEMTQETSTLDGLLIELSKKQEQIPSFIEEDSFILGIDPLELQASLPIDIKEKAFLYKRPKNTAHIVSKTYESLIIEEDEEGEDIKMEWETQEDLEGEFDAQGNFIIIQSTTEKEKEKEESSTGDDWITVKGKTKKKKTPKKTEPQTYTATQTILPPKKPEESTKQPESHPTHPTHPPKPTIQKPLPTKLSATGVDSDGFQIVLDKKSKKTLGQKHKSSK